MGKWVNIRVWPFMTIVCVTIVLSELISVVATAVVKSNKNHHLSILRIVVVVEILRRLAGVMIYARIPTMKLKIPEKAFLKS